MERLSARIAAGAMATALLCMFDRDGFGAAESSFAVPLPEGVKAVWDLELAHREITATRERLSLNGLWRWQPADLRSAQAPAGSWGYFKVPGSWPGITDYMQKDSQTVFAHPDWRETNLSSVPAAWYERELTVPADWSGRRITLGLDCLNSYAVVYLDGRRAGEARFPAGEVDLSALCRAGSKHRLSLFVAALPLQGVLLSYADSAAAREVQGTVARRGLCGDITLSGVPAGPWVQRVKVEPSVRRKDLRIESALSGVSSGSRCWLRARVREKQGDQPVQEFFSPPFTGDDLGEDGRIVFTAPWMPGSLWDVDTPENTCELEIALLDSDRRPLDVFWKEQFGFRELWIEGRDFILNGSRLYLSAVPLDNAQVGAALATYEAARESFERLRSFGVNFVYTHNYGCEPGSHLAFAEILRAADDAGMLTALSQPHFSHYEWDDPRADETNGYAGHAEYYVDVAGNHPSVVFYAMSHNATGYNEDMNPDMIDGIRDARDSWASRNVALARRAEAIVRRLDPARIIYHHASGNLGPMHPVNFYPNFVPIQEMSDWFGHWATEGIKPVFLCEYAAPFTWDWTMYRGWHRGKREFGSAEVPWEFCLAEWNAQFAGDRAYPASELEQTNLRWEAGQFREGKLWRRWDYPHPVDSSRFEERYPIFAAYLTDNWRAFRTWGVSAVSPWEYGHFWRLREGVDRGRKTLAVDWDRLQRPGFSPDYLDQRYERMDLAYERADWAATPAAEALLRNNRPLLAWIAGPSVAFTAKDHLFLPGETVEKQIIVLNNSRRLARASVRWSLDLPKPMAGRQEITLATGDQERLPLRFPLPEDTPPGRYAVEANVRFEGGETQEDVFVLDVLPAPAPVAADARIALFDPQGETASALSRLGIATKAVAADDDLAGIDLLIVGKAALTLHEAAPAIAGVREGLKVIIFEQTAEALERRLGFRTAQYGLRQVFPRVPDHSILSGITAEFLRDWRGESTLLAPRLEYQPDPKYYGAPTVQWCGLPVTRLWRCGNRGAVASVLIEKPARGDFLPVIDGGYSLQYSPLLEFREGTGLILFCQLDLTGRSERDPAADSIFRNLLRYAATWTPAPRREPVYAGDAAGRRHLESIGVAPIGFDASRLSGNTALIVGPGGGRELAAEAAAVDQWFRAGGHVLALGLDQDDLDALPGERAVVRRSEHISTGFTAGEHGSLLAGVGPADVHNRDPRVIPLLSGGAAPAGNGVLGTGLRTLYCQATPWEFENGEQMNRKRTYRRFSALISRLLGNMSVESVTPLLEHFERAVDPNAEERRWLEGFYLDQPEEWDDPYRFFRW